MKMFEICSEFVSNFYGRRNRKTTLSIANLIECTLSIAPSIEIIANSLQISNIFHFSPLLLDIMIWAANIFIIYISPIGPIA